MLAIAPLPLHMRLDLVEKEEPMTASPVSLKGHMHICPKVDPGPRPHVGGPLVSTQQNFVTVEGVPVATVGDSLLCTGVPTTSDRITSGSAVASINGKRLPGWVMHVLTVASLSKAFRG